MAAERYWPKLPVSAGPDGHTNHEDRTRGLQGPPEEVCGKRTGVDCGNDEVNEMYGKPKVRDELRS